MVLNLANRLRPSGRLGRGGVLLLESHRRHRRLVTDVADEERLGRGGVPERHRARDTRWVSVELDGIAEGGSEREWVSGSVPGERVVEVLQLEIWLRVLILIPKVGSLGWSVGQVSTRSKSSERRLTGAGKTSVLECIRLSDRRCVERFLQRRRRRLTRAEIFFRHRRLYIRRQRGRRRSRRNQCLVFDRLVRRLGQASTPFYARFGKRGRRDGSCLAFSPTTC